MIPARYVSSAVQRLEQPNAWAWWTYLMIWLLLQNGILDCCWAQKLALSRLIASTFFWLYLTVHLRGVIGLSLYTISSSSWSSTCTAFAYILPAFCQDPIMHLRGLRQRQRQISKLQLSVSPVFHPAVCQLVFFSHYFENISKILVAKSNIRIFALAVGVVILAPVLGRSATAPGHQQRLMLLAMVILDAITGIWMLLQYAFEVRLLRLWSVLV